MKRSPNASIIAKPITYPIFPNKPAKALMVVIVLELLKFPIMVFKMKDIVKKIKEISKPYLNHKINVDKLKQRRKTRNPRRPQLTQFICGRGCSKRRRFPQPSIGWFTHSNPSWSGEIKDEIKQKEVKNEFG